MDSNTVVLEISSDEDVGWNDYSGSGTSNGGDDHDWLTGLLDEVNKETKGIDNCDEVEVTSESEKPLKKLKLTFKASLVDLDDDCVILDHDPNEPMKDRSDNPVKEVDDDSDDIVVVSEKGQVACRDYPHSRHLCVKFPFSTTPNKSHCAQCYCYVCDSLAPCVKWGNGTATMDHCNATDKDDIWILERKLAKSGNKDIQPVHKDTSCVNQLPQMDINRPTPPALVQSHNQFPGPGPGSMHPTYNSANFRPPSIIASRNKVHPDLVSQFALRCHQNTTTVNQNFNLGVRTKNRPVVRVGTTANRGSVGAVTTPNQGSVRVAATPNQGSVRVAATPNQGSVRVSTTPNQGSVRVPTTANRGSVGVAMTPNQGSRVSTTANRGSVGFAMTPNQGSRVSTTANRGSVGVAMTPNQGSVRVSSTANRGSVGVATTANQYPNGSYMGNFGNSSRLQNNVVSGMHSGLNKYIPSSQPNKVNTSVAYSPQSQNGTSSTVFPQPKFSNQQNPNIQSQINSNPKPYQPNFVSTASSQPKLTSGQPSYMVPVQPSYQASTQTHVHSPSVPVTNTIPSFPQSSQVQVPITDPGFKNYGSSLPSVQNSTSHEGAESTKESTLAGVADSVLADFPYDWIFDNQPVEPGFMNISELNGLNDYMADSAFLDTGSLFEF
ncbi:uncharacterized protein [Rutidosis leptorrhynchoides]|uniref:uncharacterized protein n=1 Tax=Rutidosis leptorrhynchoides TaxID=125765 RepID=UPI003A99F332